MAVQQVRVLHVITGLDAGGAESQLLSLQPAFSRLGIEQHVVSLAAGGALLESFRQAFGEIVQLNAQRGRASPRVLRDFRQVVRNLKPDVVHAWMYHACAVSVAVPANTAVIWGIRHGLAANEQLRSSTRLLIHLLPMVSWKPIAIVFNSTTSRQQHGRIGYPMGKSHVVHNGVDSSRFLPNSSQRQATRDALGIPPGGLLVGFVGRLHSIKGWDVFCHAASKVRQQHGQVRFVMAGANDLSSVETVRALAASVGLEDALRVIGYQADIVPLMRSLDLLVLPSRSEGFPNVVAESMACGVPCVATDVGEVREIVGSCGEVVEKAEAELLAEAIVRLLRQGPASLTETGSAARKRVIERFSLENAAARYASLYGRCVAAR